MSASKKYKHTTIAIDPSSVRLAYVVTWPHGEEFILCELPKDKIEACGHAYRYTKDVLYRFSSLRSPPTVFCERQVGSPRGGYNALIPQAHVSGAIMAATSTTATPAPFVPVQVGAWKKAVIGVGSAGKDLVADRIKILWPSAWEAAQQYPKTKGRQDIIDAAAMNIWGRMFINGKIQ